VSKVITCPLWRDFKENLTEQHYVLWLHDCCRCARTVVVMGKVRRDVEAGADVVCEECAQAQMPEAG